MFILKKIIAPFFFPLPIIVFLLFSGLYLLWFTKKHKLGKTIVTLGACFLTILSYDLPANVLIMPLERYYKPYLNEMDNSFNPRYIVVLGGGASSDPSVPVTSQLSTSSIVRLMEGIRIYCKNPNSKLILSGGAVFNTRSEAEIMAELAKKIGIENCDIIVESSSRDTKEQAQLIAPIVASEKLVLVTSASHMPRSMALFKKQGMNPIPAPTMHLYLEKQKIRPGSFFPSAQALKKVERAFYEVIGIVWSKLCGNI